MGKEIPFDVIIIGGGPAGLSIGSELSKNYKVLVVDKNVAGVTSRSWFVPLDVLDEGVKPFTYGGVTRFLASTFTGAKLAFQAKLFDRYPYVNEKTILPYWLDVIKSNRSQVIDNCAYLDHTVKDGVVSVQTTKGCFASRLLIDASGYNSIILDKYKIKRNNFYWWSVYGAVGEHPNGLQSMQVGDYMMWQTFKDSNENLDTSLAQGRPVFEYEIYDDKTSLSLVLYLRKVQISYSDMEKEYLHVIRNEDSTKPFHDLKIKEIKYGWYPSGNLSQQIAEDHVVFVGDSGCWTTPCGWGMGFILDNYQFFSSQLSKVLAANTLDKASLLSIPHYKVHQKYEVLMNTLATHFLSNATAPQLDKFINLYNQVDPILCEKMLTLKMSEKELREMLKVVLKTFDLKELVQIIPKQDYLLVLEEAKYVVEDTVINKIHDMIHFVSGHEDKPKLNDGFEFQ
ncbi:MAG: hypothetical protein HW390_313 [Candidatus Brocadiaceae bacterium]|nr:hypothetical protein [Candidatus Brocadiaceae bacterium]